MEEESMESIMDNHEQRIGVLERQYTDVMTKMNDIDKTVRDEGREQRDLLNRLLDHSLGMVKQKDNNRTRITIAALGGGGVMGVIIGAIVAVIKLFM